MDHQGVLWCNNRIVVPKDHQLRKQILDEAHLSKFSIHPGSTKMYQDLRQNFWWTRMKRKKLLSMYPSVVHAKESKPII
jgi:hypothetical protein